MGTGQFTVSNGLIIAPNGTNFVARGINIFPGQVDGNTIMSAFPGINMVRVAATPGTDPSTLDSLVQTLTANKVVVEIEDHSSSGGNPNTSTGAALSSEEGWHASLASRYASNPYVWFGTANEPDDTADMSTISAQEAGIYNAIRGAGNNSPVMLEMRGGFTNDFAQATPGTYAVMHNVVWDTHFYGWVPNYSTDPNAIASALKAQIANAQSVRSADGAVPVIIGEYGVSTTGLGGTDNDGTQVVSAVDSSGYGTLAWAWNAGTDALTSGFNTLTAFGQQVASHIASAPPAQTPPGPQNPHQPASPDNTLVTAAKGGSITDASGNVWSIANGQVVVNGTPDGTTSNVVELAYEKGLIWQENSSQMWWSEASPNGTWGPAGGTSTSPIPSTPPTVSQQKLALALSEDAYTGNAQFIAKIDGQQLGPAQSVTALNSAGKTQTFTFTGNWATGAHSVEIDFTNDAYAGPGKDRNLYVDQVTFNGHAAMSKPSPLYSNGALTIHVGQS